MSVPKTVDKDGLTERAKTALSFANTDYRIALGKLFITSPIVLTDDKGEDRLSPERFREFLNGLMGIVGGS